MYASICVKKKKGKAGESYSKWPSSMQSASRNGMSLSKECFVRFGPIIKISALNDTARLLEVLGRLTPDAFYQPCLAVWYHLSDLGPTYQQTVRV